MPNRLPRPCRYPGCPALTPAKSGYCSIHEKQLARQYDKDRGTASQRGYDARWRRASKLYLAEHPLCALCAKETPPVIRAAVLVDHIIPHRGDYALFWDESNWQSSCKECHDIKTAKEDGAFGNRGRGIKKPTT